MSQREQSFCNFLPYNKIPSSDVKPSGCLFNFALLCSVPNSNTEFQGLLVLVGNLGRIVSTG